MGFALRSGNGTLVLVALLSLLALTIDTTWQTNAAQCDAVSNKNAIRIGGLFPGVKKRNDLLDAGGIARQIAAMLAVEEMNNKTDGIWDDKLLQHKVELFVRDSQRDETASVLAAFKVASQIYGKGREPVCGQDPALRGVHGIIGPGSSAPTIDVQSILADINIAQVGYSATSPELSNSDAYPYFVRTPPADNIQAEVMAVLIRDLLNDKEDLDTNLVLGSGSYSEAGSKKFRYFADKYNISIRTESLLKSSNPSQEDIDRVVDRLRESNCYLTVMFAQLDDIAQVIRTAHAKNYKSTWLLSETAVAGPGRTDLQKQMENKTEILKGIFSTAPSNGLNRTAYSSFEKRWLAQASTRWMEDGEDVCSNATDASGRHIWRRELSSGAEVCLGKDFELAAKLRAGNECNSTERNKEVCESVKITQYVPFAYDAAQAMLLAFDTLTRQHGPGPLTVSAEEVFNAMLQVNFSGISGQVMFKKTGAKGDRVSSDLEFIVYNHDGESGFNAIGSVQSSEWRPCDSDNFPYPCEKSIYFNDESTMPTVWAKPKCTATDFNYSVGVCNTSFAQRKVTFEWKKDSCRDGSCCKGDKPKSQWIHCDYIPEASGAAIITFVLVFVSALACIAVLVWMVVNRSTREVIGSQPMFCVLILVGAACMPISCCFLIGEMQDYKCILSEWILWFWFSVCLSALAVKTLRVYLLFVKLSFNKNVANIVAPSKTIMWMIGMICPMLIFMIVRTTVTETWFRPVERKIVLGESTPIVVNYETQQCTVETILSSNAPTDTDTRKVVRMIIVILCRLYILAMISAIGYFSFNTRKVPQRFSESRWILISFYNIIVMFTAMVFRTIFGIELLPGVSLVSFTFATVGTSMAMVLPLFVPKMIRVYKFSKNPGRRNTSFSKRKRSRSAIDHESKEIQHVLNQLEPVGHVAVEKLYKENAALKAEKHDLLDHVTNLREQVWNLKTLPKAPSNLQTFFGKIKRAFSNRDVMESKRDAVSDIMESKRDTVNVTESEKQSSSISESKQEERESKKDSSNDSEPSTSRTEPGANSNITPTTNSSSAGTGNSADMV